MPTSNPTYSDEFASVLEPCWKMDRGTWSIATDLQVAGSGALFPQSVLRYNPIATYTDADAAIVIGEPGKHCGVFIRGQGEAPFNGYVVTHVDSSGLRLWVVTNDVASLIASDPTIAAIGDSIGIRAVGTDISILHNGTELTVVFDATFASGYAGVVSEADNPAIQSFSVAPI